MSDETSVDRDVAGMKATMLEGLWSELMPSYNLTDVEITWIIKGTRDLVTRRAVTLEIAEGRSPIYFPEEDGVPGSAALQYRLDFSTGHGPDEIAFDRGRVWIRGTHPNGRRVEIRGPGFVFSDPIGDLVGEFLKPPEILIEDRTGD